MEFYIGLAGKANDDVVSGFEAFCVRYLGAGEEGVAEVVREFGSPDPVPDRPVRRSGGRRHPEGGVGALQPCGWRYSLRLWVVLQP